MLHPMPSITEGVLISSLASSSPFILFWRNSRQTRYCFTHQSATHLTTTAKTFPSLVVPSKITDTYLPLNPYQICAHSWSSTKGPRSIICLLFVSLYPFSSSKRCSLGHSNCARRMPLFMHAMTTHALYMFCSDGSVSPLRWVWL